MFIRKFGVRTLVFVIMLTLVVASLYYFYADGLISVYLFAVCSVFAIALIILNIVERFALLEKEAEKTAKEGDEFYKKGEFNAALQRYENALVLDDEIFRARMGIGHVLKIKNEPQKAIKEYKKAMIIDPESGMPYYHMAICHNLTGNFKQAVIELEKSIKKKNEPADAYKMLGDLYYRQGDNVEAKNNYEKYINLVRDGDARKEAKEKLEKIIKVIEAKKEQSPGL